MDEMYPVISGAEEFYFQGGDIGILISHGFMGTPQSVHYIGKKLAQYKYTVLAPRMKGHGTHYFDLEKCTHKDWFHSLEKGYTLLKERCSIVFVIGQSMGGTLALKLAHQYPDLQGIVIINPALTIPAFENAVGKTKPRFIEEEKPDIKANGVYEITYEKTPLTAIHELQTLMESTPAILPEVYTPILSFKSAVDHVVPPENTDFIMNHVGSAAKRKIILENSYHVASMDNYKEKIVEESHLFVQQQMNKVAFL